MKKLTVEAAELQNAAYNLFILLQEAESHQALAAQREDVMNLMHQLNAAYFNWAYVVDPEASLVVD